MDLEKVKSDYPLGTKLFVIVSRVEDFGAFVDLPDKILGYIPCREISWTPDNILDAREKLNIGEQVDVQVLKVESRGVVLSIREALGNPWPKFCREHNVGDQIEGRVARVFEQTAFIELAQGVKGVIETGGLWTKVEKMSEALLVGDRTRAQILKFEAEEQKVLLSIAALFQEDEKANEPDSHWKMGETNQEVFDLMSFSLNREIAWEIGLSQETKERMKKILVVDPDPEVIDSTTAMLESFGFTADSAITGKEALEKFEQQSYDLVLTAVNLPDLDGIVLSRQLIQNNSGFPVIIQLGEDITQYWERLQEFGLQNNLLMKPWQLVDLVKLINDAALGKLGQTFLPVRTEEDFDFIDRISQSLMEQADLKTTIETILEKLQEETQASFIVIFQMHLTTLETGVFAQVGLKKELNDTQKKLLRFSPVQDVIYHNVELKNIQPILKRLDNLQNLGNFQSIMARKINFESDLGYGLFLFGDQESRFGEELHKLKTTTLILGTAIERYRMEEVYKQQHKFLLNGRLSASLIHELKNEQLTIFNYINVLKTASNNLNSGKIKPDDKFLARFQRVVNALMDEQNKVQNIQYLFLNLLREKNEEQVDLSEHIYNIVNAINPIAKEAKIEVFPPTNKVRKCWLNTSRFTQVIVNILINSIEQITLIRKMSGKIWIDLDWTESDSMPIKIIIKDNGLGIHTAHLDRIFDIFFTTKVGGTGMGLFISKALIQSLGGKISVKETIRYSGTTFLIELPVRKGVE